MNMMQTGKSEIKHQLVYCIEELINYLTCVIALESLRNGELCEVYKLTRGVESYMMNRFKEAAGE
jgi:hypothetical protein